MNIIIPVILLKELIILPNQEIKIELNNKLSKLIMKKALDEFDSRLLVVTPTDAKEEEPSIDDLPNVGVIAKIKNKIQLPNGNIRITLRGLKRVIVSSYFLDDKDENILDCNYQELQLPKFASSEEAALKRKLIATLKEYIDSSENVSNSILTTVAKAKSLAAITDIIASFLPFNFEKKSEYMQNYNPLNRAINLLNDLQEEAAINKLDAELDDKVNARLENDQKEFILKEKLKVIKSELGDKTAQEQDAEMFLAKLESLKLPSAVKNKVAHEIEKYSLITETSPELSVSRTYIDWILSLPWNKVTKDPKDQEEVLKCLNKTHYGLDKVKERISEFAYLKNKNNSLRAPIICLIGPPGVGKTSIAMAIAEALNRKFYKISVGGLNDATELIGSRRTYLGASPGKIIQGLRKCGSKNPVLLIDEVDKMTRDYHGDPASTLLEIIDPVQNKFFTDNYIEEAFDLSEVLFILTANSYDNIPPVLLDRVEVIELSSYTLFEKKDIAKLFLLPRLQELYQVPHFTMNDNLIYDVIENYTAEAGVRDLERTLDKIMRKMIIAGKIRVMKKDILEILGHPKNYNLDISHGTFGEVNVLAVGRYGGFCSKLEVAVIEGNDHLYITGCIGDVMEESVLVAISYLKNIYHFNFDKRHIHVHFLDASTSKNGPSAGVAITVGLVSIMENKKVDSNTAFTGEISLTGEIIRIGGLKEKLIAAYNKNITTVYIPKDNVVDLEDIPDVVKEKMTIIPVNNFKEVYTKIFK